MKLLLLRDKKPGHFHQAEGVAMALQRVAKIDITRLDVRQRPFILVGLMRLAMQLPLSPRFGLWALYGIRLKETARPDGIVASGRATAAAAILLARHFKVPLVFSGRLTGYDTGDIALMLSGGDQQGSKAPLARVPKPGIVDARQFPPAPRLRSRADLSGARLALLIGGDATDHRYERQEWDCLMTFLTESHAALGVTWHVSNSRRTPAYLTPALAGLAASGAIAEFVDFANAGPGSANHLFGMDAVVVTQDSHSMVAEALAARRPVIALKPAIVTSGYQPTTLASAAERGQIAVMPIVELASDSFATILLRLTVAPTADPWDLIAEAVAPVFGLKLPAKPA
jgi:mitochondrial fission protein ELM1